MTEHGAFTKKEKMDKTISAFEENFSILADTQSSILNSSLRYMIYTDEKPGKKNQS